MIRADVFLHNHMQALHLPKSVALDGDVREVTVVAVGRARLITPVGESWDSWFDGPGATPDFLAERDQADVQEREVR